MEIKGNYIIITHSNGKRKVYTIEQYHRRHAIRYALYIIGGLLITLLLCGATYDIGKPERVFAVIMMCGASVGLLIAGIVAACCDKEDGED